MDWSSAATLWVVAALAGSMVFFGAIVAPLVFQSLPADKAGSFLRAFFPRYYLWGLALAVIAAIAALATTWVNTLLCIVVATLFVYARNWLMPRINRSRDAALDGDTQASTRFERLHRLSVAINMVQLVVLLVVAVLVAL